TRTSAHERITQEFGGARAVTSREIGKQPPGRRRVAHNEELLLVGAVAEHADLQVRRGERRAGAARKRGLVVVQKQRQGTLDRLLRLDIGEALHYRLVTTDCIF